MHEPNLRPTKNTPKGVGEEYYVILTLATLAQRILFLECLFVKAILPVLSVLAWPLRMDISVVFRPVPQKKPNPESGATQPRNQG